MNKNFKISLLVFFILGAFILLTGLSSEKEDQGVIKIKADNFYIPKKLSFAGEIVPIHRIDIKEQLERELIVNNFFHSQTIQLLKKKDRYFKIIEPILKKNNIPDDFKYLAVAESGLIPTIMSPAGAVGLWQFLTTTGKENGLIINKFVDERYNIEKSTEAACKFLNKLYEDLKSWSLVSAAYNSGKRNVLNQIKRQKNSYYYDMLWNNETGRYLFRIVALKVILNNPKKYGFFIKKKYPIIKTKYIKVSTSIDTLANFAHKHKVSYKTLKNFNPWLRQSNLENKKKNTFKIKIPANPKDFCTTTY